jgi:hypothetical protein
MSSIPTTTTPLAKFIRTGEGVLVFAFNGALLVVPIVSGALTPEQAVQWAAIINGVTVVSRTGLKIVAVLESASEADAPQPAVPAAGYVPTGDANPGAASAAADTEAADSPNTPIETQVSDAEELMSVPPSAQAAPMSDRSEVPFAPAQFEPDGQPVGAGWA